MTKEEILEERLGGVYDKKIKNEGIEGFVYAAMEKYADEKVGEFISKQNSFTYTEIVPKHILDSYAEQEKKKDSVAFLLWCVNNHSHYEGFSVNKFNDNRQETIFVNNEEISLDQLYQLYLQHKSKNNSQ